MHSLTAWRRAQPPNYTINKDKEFPYSEVPFLGDYRLVKIPASSNDLIEHVDYWGEGKIVSQFGISGFSDSYNVNHTFQLVSNGPDRDRKIPNRIPVVNYTNCDTSGYIKNNSVITVTIMGAPINSSCAKDIARMVNTEHGQVIAYGFESKSAEIRNLITELKKKSIFYYPSYTLTNKLEGLTLFDSHMGFVNLSTLKDELHRKVTCGSYDDAVNLTKNLDGESGDKAISDAVVKLFNTGSSNVVAFAYKLWNSGAKEIIRKNFPPSFSLIFNGDNVNIVNVKFQLALKLDVNVDSYNDRLAWGDASDKTSLRLSWKIIPEWENNNVTFKLHNNQYDMYLKLDVNVDSFGDRKAWGSKNFNEVRHKYNLEPLMKNEKLVFRIINCQYHQGLKMDQNVDDIGDRQVWGHNGDAHTDYEPLDWIIVAQ